MTWNEVTFARGVSLLAAFSKNATEAFQSKEIQREKKVKHFLAFSNKVQILIFFKWESEWRLYPDKPVVCFIFLLVCLSAWFAVYYFWAKKR